MFSLICPAACLVRLIAMLLLVIPPDGVSAAPDTSASASSAPQPASSTGNADTTRDEDGNMTEHAHMVLSAALGPYPMTREASGTAWQPDSSVHEGVHVAVGEWTVMSHALLNAVYDRQEGPRGDDKAFVSGMLMSAATRVLPSDDIVRLRAMLSPEPLMGASGYPLLLATGETANGKDPLIDRQHPHDLFTELSGSFSHPLGAGQSVYLYAGLPGEPAFGPPAFMHRLSILDDPAAPITHHWLDSTHISNGVVTLGYVHDDFKLEVSRFYGREPDQYRYRIEPGPLDSIAARFSWNPTQTLSLQISWAHQISPEQLDPHEDETRASGSAIYTAPLGEDRYWSTTVAYGYRHGTDSPHLWAYLLESTVKPTGSWTIFARFEREANNELIDLGGQPGPIYNVGEASLGAIRDLRISPHIKVGLGALYAFNSVPPSLTPLYGHGPAGMMVFVRLKVE
jgi:hypothetical protein